MLFWPTLGPRCLNNILFNICLDSTGTVRVPSTLANVTSSKQLYVMDGHHHLLFLFLTDHYEKYCLCQATNEKQHYVYALRLGWIWPGAGVTYEFPCF